jgi:hypothetical protein
MSLSGVFASQFIPVNEPNIEAIPITNWQAGASYVVGQVVRESATSFYYWQCIAAGTAGSSAPQWTRTGANVTDNTVTWAQLGAGNPGDLVQRPQGWVGFIVGDQPLTSERVMTLKFDGVGRVPKASATTFVLGANVWFNIATGLAVTSQPTYGFLIGTARAPAISGQTSVLVTLNRSFEYLGDNCLVMTGAGAPTNGTSGSGAGYAGIGSLYINKTSGTMYQNTGTLASPTWTAVHSESST